MSVFETSSPFAEQVIQPYGVQIGSFFEHYQHLLTAKEEAVLGMRCMGKTWVEISLLLLTTVPVVKQIERRGIAHMVWLYRRGK